MFGTLINLLNEVKDTYTMENKTESFIIEKYSKVPLLIIDDLGKERPSEWTLEKLFTIINNRYENNLPVVITTNYNRERLRERLASNVNYEIVDSIISRLYEMCKGINFENFYKKSLSNTDYYKFAKEDIDYAIEHSWSYKEFLKRLKDMGYEIYFRAEKISIRRYPNKRNIRIERAFGEQYSIENIKNKICSRYPTREEVIKPKTYGSKLFLKGTIKHFSKPKGFKALYLYYCYLLKVYPKKNMEYKLTPAMRAEVKKMEEYSRENILLGKYKITNSNELNECKTNLNGKLKDLIRQRNNLYYKRQNMAENENKEDFNKKIELVSKEITKIRDEIKLCDKIEGKVPIMKEELEKFKTKENEKQTKEKQEKTKKKSRDYYR